jgi:hypothetical protein
MREEGVIYMKVITVRKTGPVRLTSRATPLYANALPNCRLV